MENVECRECHRMIPPEYITESGACEECVELATEPEVYDDPVCVCGVHWSEHALCGCPEGFQSAASWEREKEFIASLDDDMFERIYHPFG